jgi:hypothetical protein
MRRALRPFRHMTAGQLRAGAFAEGKDRATLAFGVNKGQERDSFGINRRPVTVYLTGKFREGRLTGVVSMVVETRPDTTGQILNPEWIRTRAKKIKETSVAVEHETQMLYDKDSVRLDPATVKAAYARENADTRTPAEKAQAARTRAAQLAALGAIGAVATGRGGQLLNEIGNSSRGAASSPKAVLSNSSRPISMRRISLGRARADFIKLGIAQQPPGGIIVDVAVAAEQLDRVQRALRRTFRGQQNRTGGILARRLAAVAGRATA